jgi:hypothetical protein
MFDRSLGSRYLDDLSRQATLLRSESSGVDLEVAELKDLVAKMALVNQALYELLKARTGITDEDLRLKVREIDRRDGAEDGRMHSRPVHCPKCHTVVSAGALSCPGCGATIAPKSPYED